MSIPELLLDSAKHLVKHNWGRFERLRLPCKIITVFITLLIILCIFWFAGFRGYLQLRDNVAFKIYPEITINNRKITVILKKSKDSNEIDFKNYQFVSFGKANFDKHYKSFGINKLDAPIGHFYTNLSAMDHTYNVKDYEAMRDHGKSALKELKYYFACEDYSEGHPAEKEDYNIASPDEVMFTRSLFYYSRYRLARIRGG